MSARLWFAAALALLALGAVAFVDATHEDPGSVLWSADAESPALREWASARAEDAGGKPCTSAVPSSGNTPRIRRSSTVVAQGRRSYEVTLEPGDSCDGERAELGQGNPTRPGFDDRLFEPGDDRYIAFQVRLASNFDVDAPGWRLIAQIHQRGDLGTPALSLNVERGRFVLYRSDSNVDSHDTVAMWSAPATKGRWVRFTLHVGFSSDPADGFVELWGNPAGGPMAELLRRTPVATMKRDATGATVPDHARIGIFRDAAARFGTETVYYDGFTVATTRDAAERHAFAPAD